MPLWMWMCASITAYGASGRIGGQLGLGRSKVRCALHDPNEDNALVLYEPPQTAQPPPDPSKVKVHGIKNVPMRLEKGGRAY